MKKIFTVLILTLLTISLNPIAHASAANSKSAKSEKGWRYWGYFQAAPGANSWSYAQAGPAATIARDGAVEGWRYSFSSDTVDTGSPTLRPNFKATCAGVRIQSGYVRVAVVVDFGPRAIAPKGESTQQTIRQCAVVKSGSNGFEILKQVVPIRTDASGFVCGLNNFPAKECSTEIQTPRSLARK
ncbi:MAG: SCO2322 family protein [Candidatus Nanopelagicaceae bacterium]